MSALLFFQVACLVIWTTVFIAITVSLYMEKKVEIALIEGGVIPERLRK